MGFKPRPQQRRHTTFALKVGTEVLFLSLAKYDDGTPMEIFVDIQKEGTTIRGLMDAVARLVSRGWQFGVLYQDIIDQFTGTSFMPNGIGRGHAAIDGVVCSSLLDAIGRVLDAELGENHDTA